MEHLFILLPSKSSGTSKRGTNTFWGQENGQKNTASWAWAIHTFPTAGEGSLVPPSLKTFQDHVVWISEQPRVFEGVTAHFRRFEFLRKPFPTRNIPCHTSSPPPELAGSEQPSSIPSSIPSSSPLWVDEERSCERLAAVSGLHRHPLGVSLWLSCPWGQELCPSSGGLKFPTGSFILAGFPDRCSPGFFAAVSGELPWAVANFARREFFFFLRKPFWSH